MSRLAGHVVVDIGNSGLKAAVVDQRPRIGLREILTPTRRSWHRAFQASDSTPSKGGSGSLELEFDSVDPFGTLFREMQLDPHDSYLWMVSSVQRVALELLKEQLHGCRPQDTLRMIHFRDVPMKALVEFPEQLGIDRLLAAWGAWIEQGMQGPIIVVQAGTAVTVDWVNEDGEFAGGAILPGIPLALRLLSAGTDQLPQVDAPHNFSDIVLPGLNTQQAMRGGASAAVLGGTSWLIDHYRNRFGAEVPVVVSGGDGISMAPSLPAPVHQVDHLVLRALASLVSLP